MESRFIIGRLMLPLDKWPDGQMSRPGLDPQVQPLRGLCVRMAPTFNTLKP